MTSTEVEMELRVRTINQITHLPNYPNLTHIDCQDLYIILKVRVIFLDE